MFENIHLMIKLPSYDKLIIAIILIIIAVIIIKLSSFIIKKITNKFEVELTLSYLIRDSIKYIILIIVIIIVLRIFGVDITGILWSLGIIGLSIGFAGRDIISNFISGVFILSDKTVKVGEKIEVSGVVGKVKKVGFRTTTLLTAENKIVTIPNSALSKNPYSNYTYLNEHRIDLDIIVPYNKDLIILKEKLIKMYNTLDWTLENSQPRIDVVRFEDEGIVLKFGAWANDYSKRFEYKLELANKIREILY
ncbi:MAG: mechanosensitive ion channel family protein [Methanobrevibacter sp.]|jgi:small conductance mechanosensitive channel|nr:mechanosensitive ion channel family protein [Candidatus Methanoflexus mossambicus]